MKNRILNVLFCLIMVCTLFPMTVFAESIDIPADVDGSKTAFPIELSASNKITTVTLSLPSAEYQNEVDIVFVMDKSSSTANNSIDFSDNVMELLSELQALNTELKINVGIIKFRGYATDAINQASNAERTGLTQYTSDTAQVIEAAIDVTPPGSGTNLHGALDLANDWLSADTKVADENKYVIVLTDGKSYIWNNDRGEATTNYTQYYKLRQIQNNGMPTLNQQAGASDKAVSAYTPYNPQYMNDQPITGSAFWFDDYAALYASNNAELSGQTVYDQYCYYAYGTNPEGASPNNGMPQGTMTAHDVVNGSTVFPSDYFSNYRKYYKFTPATGWEDVRYFEANPYVIIRNEDGTYSFDAETLNENFYMLHPDCLQKGLYKAGHLWSDMNEKYHCGAVIFDGWKDGAGLSVAKSFCTWLKNNSEYGANISNVAEIEALFDSISTEITYMIDSGIVTDVITNDFDLVIEENTCPFNITVAGDILSPIKIDGEDNAWGFGVQNINGTTYYSYKVIYEPENEAGKTIIWQINVPVENAKPVALSYNLRIKDNAATGVYDTNESAVLSYMPTNQQVGERYNFEKPKVSYTAPTNGGGGSSSHISITAKKVWKLDDGGQATDSIKVIRYRNGVAYGDAVELNEKNNWTYTWKGQSDYFSWTVDEVEVPEGFDKSVSIAAETSIDGKVFIITNDDISNEPGADIPAIASEIDPTGGIPAVASDPANSDKEIESTVPKTDDSSNMILWIIIASISLIGIVAVFSKRKRFY